MKFKIFISILFLSLSIKNATAQECGKVSIADMNWSSASFLAYVDQFILVNGYNCDAELVPGDTNPTGTSMIEKGEPDVAPEMWTNGIKEALDKGIEEKRLRMAGRSLSDGGEEGFWVPRYMVEEYPDLVTIEGFKKHADLFKHPENPEKSAIYGCPAGWACQITTGNLFKALQLGDAGFEMIDPGSGAGLSGSIAKAYARQEPWAGYYWAPTAVLGKYDMVRIDFGSGVDEEHFRGCILDPDCADPQPTMFPNGPVFTVTTEDFAANASAAYEYLSTRSFSNDEMNQLLLWMEDNQADGEYAMIHFMQTEEDKWKQWLTTEAYEKVKVAVSSL